MSMQGKEHFRTIEDYLDDRGWVKDGKSWVCPRGPRTFRYSEIQALGQQVDYDTDPEDGGWTVEAIGITLERA